MIFAAALLTAFSAHAATATDWALSGCTASTTASSTTGAYRLEVGIDETHARPLEVRIAAAAAGGVSSGGLLSLDKKTNYAFVPVDQVAWNVPRGTLNLISYLRRQSKTLVVFGTEKVTFSLKGSSAALTALSKSCNAGQEFESDGFERAFLPAIVANIDPSLVHNATSLREIVAKGFTAFRTSGDLQTQLNVLSQQFLTQIKEYEQLRSNLDKLTNDTVARLTKARSDAQAVVAKAQVEIPQLQAQVSAQEQLLVPANAALAQAKADIAPFAAPLQQYQNTVDDAEDDVSRAQTDLRNAQAYEAQMRSRYQDAVNGVASTQNAISQINSQISSLRTAAWNAQNDADRARNNWQSESSRRSSFNKSSEVSRRQQSDSRLSSIDSQLRDAHSRMSDAQRHIQDAEADRARAGGDLRTCQAVQPGKDCSQEQDLSNRSDQRMQQAHNEYNGLQNTISSLDSQKSNFRSTIENEVDRDYQDLCRRESDAQNAYQNTQNVVADLNSQLSRSLNSDLPAAQSALSSWQNAVAQADLDVRSAVSGTSQASRNVSVAQSGEDTAEARRNAWKQSSGYNARVRTLSSAQSTVDTINSALNSLDRSITSRQKLIRDQTTLLASIEAKMQVALATIAQKEARSKDVQKILEPYFTQRDALATQKAAADAAFKDAQSAFVQGVTPVAPTPAAPVVAATE